MPPEFIGTMTVKSPDGMKDLLSCIPSKYELAAKRRAEVERAAGGDLEQPRQGRRAKSSAAHREDRDKKMMASKAAMRIAEKRRLLGIQDKKMQAKLKEDIRNRMISHARKQRADEAKRLQAIEDEEAGFVQEVNQRLKQKETEEKITRKELLNLWTEKVYGKIENQIAKQVRETDPTELAERLESQMEDYVQTVGRKTVFRDIIIESEYDPFSSKKHQIKVDARLKTRDHEDGIVDPLREQIDKVMEIHEGMEHLLKGGGRESDLPVARWAQVEATPHGFAAKAFDDIQRPKDPVVQARKWKRSKSDGVEGQLDHYTYARGFEGMKVAAKEAGAGKRCFPGWAPGGQTTTLKEWRPPFAMDGERPVENPQDPLATT